MKPLALLTLLLTALTACAPSRVAMAQTDDPASVEAEDEDESKMNPGMFAALGARSIGPAVASGRIGDIAVNPCDFSEWYVAVSSGGVWKTTNNGATFSPIFDGEGSYSIGCVTIDPNDTNVVWVGTGENNSQRSVSFGDGVYKSVDGGKSWKNTGLKESEHIGMIAIDPYDSDIVFVAAQGPLWRSGGDRGLYRTTDGGETWDKVLEIDEHTGVNEVHIDPADPDIMYASAYQRARKVWTLVNGGPGSGIYKSTDAGVTWREVATGLPTVDMGRIGLDISPADPNTVYAIVEAADDKGGFFRSTDKCETWDKRSDFMTSSPQYYNEIVCDPNEVDRVYVSETFLRISEDGGATFSRVRRGDRHVDDHALWIDPTNTDHMIAGCDGGIYDTWDAGGAWHFRDTLPITQFYRVAVDNDYPFYNIVGGTQDNNTLLGPSRTRSQGGIANEDWIVTVGGDGFEPQIDPTDPDIVYSQWQYGGLIRFDKNSGEALDIKPRQKPGEAPYVFNWDAPLLISPHDNKRIYFGGNFLFRSEDRGDSWERITDNLSRGLDRNQLEIMGAIQKPDAVAKHTSTSIYGNSVALSESPLVEGLLYVGTDDGLIHVSENNGRSWRKIDAFPGIPGLAYVSCLTASRHNPDRVYASFDNHKDGDFKPYLLRSDDRGRTWTPAMGDLPERDSVWSIQEDHLSEGLLFAGTEFGAYFTVDGLTTGGGKWLKFQGMPTIAVKDIDIQRRENDLAFATFGRSIYIVDDYSPLRTVSEAMLTDTPAAIFPVRAALRYVQTNRFADNTGTGSQGDAYYRAPNPPFGAVFTYYLRDKLETHKEQRLEAEKEEAWDYPTIDQFRAEDRQREPATMLVVRDSAGAIVRRIEGSRESGIHRASWDLRWPFSGPARLASEHREYWEPPVQGPLATPGRYSVELVSVADGKETTLAGPQPFEVEALDLGGFADTDKAGTLAFEMKVADLHRALTGALSVANEAHGRLDLLRVAINDTPRADPTMLERLETIEAGLDAVLVSLRGDPTLGRRVVPAPESISEQIDNIVYGQWGVTTAPTQTMRQVYDAAAGSFELTLGDLRRLVERDLRSLETDLESLGAPWTPGRVPTWRR
jgi:photosystem II stability/assembly factor-like uncharacterized protein